jgi:hypothetical protein
MPAVLRKGAARLRAIAAPHARASARLAAAGAMALAFSSCTVSGVLTPQVDVGVQTSSVAQSQPRGFARLVPSNPMMAAYPRLSQPLATPGAVMPAEETECRRQLRRLGVTFSDLAPIDEGGACRIDHPVRVSGLAGNVEMKPAATLSCPMALAFAQWTRNELSPAARWRYLSGVKTIHQGSSYSCRRIAGTSTPSEHSKGNALDVMRIELRSGRDIDVRKPGWFRFRERSLLNNVRARAAATISAPCSAPATMPPMPTISTSTSRTAGTAT